MMKSHMTMLVALSLMTVGFVFSPAASADHSGTADTCEENDILSLRAWDEKTDDEGVDGEYYCGGGGSTCAAQDDNECKSSVGGAWFDDDTPVCRGRADHVRCSSSCCSDASKLLEQIKNLKIEASMALGENVTAGTTSSVMGIFNHEAGFGCVDGHCVYLEPDCVSLNPIGVGWTSCEVSF